MGEGNFFLPPTGVNMAFQKIQVICPVCRGTGKRVVNYNGDGSPMELTCSLCSGSGFIDSGLLLQQESIVGIIPTYKILEVTDSDEYAALDANKKHWYDLFISAGTLDMSDGTKANDLFLAWLFPPGKITHAALLAILS